MSEGLQQLVRRRAVDEERCKRVIAGTDMGALFELRAEMVEVANRIRTQLDADDAVAKDELVDLLDAGVDPVEAGLRKMQSTDHHWRARAKAVLRIIDSWNTKIRARIVQLSPNNRPVRAVCMRGVARSGEDVASALNQLMDAGCKILSFGAFGTDLVVLATEPGTSLKEIR